MRYEFSVKISIFLPLAPVYNRLISKRKSSPGNITHARKFQTRKNPARGYIFWCAWQVKLEKGKIA